MGDIYTVTQKRYEPSDPRLGRHVRHDSRSLNFQVEAAPLSSLKSVRHRRFIPILDQGKVGSCVPNAGEGCLGTGLFYGDATLQKVISATDAAADEKLALDWYHQVTVLDPYPGVYPPNDTGSDGLSIAKLLVQLGLISGYQHATSLEAALTALAAQPVIVGTVWKYDMFRPQSDGRIKVTGSDEGGHEYVLDELDMENKRVWMVNSWTVRWGLGGRAYLTFDDLGALLADHGDCTVFTPRTAPAPQPTPPSPQPTPVVVDEKAEFIKEAKLFQVALNRFIEKG